MGLAEQITAGASFERQTVSFTVASEAQRSGSVDIGSAYAILAIQSSVPCRLRLYDNLNSVKDLTEASRSFGNTSIADSIALVGDFSMSAGNTLYTTDPVLYGVVASTTSSYYRVTQTTFPVQISITQYPIEDFSLSTSVPNRKTIANIEAKNLAVGVVSSSVISNVNIPQTYLLVSASLSGSNNRARVRLYNTSASLTVGGEKTRPFNVEPTSSTVGLIVDMLMTGSQTVYFTPKIIGANLDNMGTSLAAIRFGDSGIYSKVGENELYVHLENKQNVTGDVNVSLHLYSLED